MTACETYEIQENFFKTVDQSLIKTMKHDLQYDFFLTEQESEVERLIRMTEEIKKSTGAVRRKLFAENGSLKKRVLELEQRLSYIESYICNGDSNGGNKKIFW